MMTKRRYGWLPDVPDRRDFRYQFPRPPRDLPRSVDLRGLCSPVEDQGTLGSCTACALVGALEFLWNKAGVEFEDLSRLFVYYNERALEWSVEWDNGAMIRDGIKTLKRDGVCRESSWPYLIDKFREKPTDECYREALDRQIISYSRLSVVDQMRACLADGFPFVFGFTIYESFEAQEVARTGIAPMPGEGERALGGHAVLAVGYDDGEQRFTVRNSWGEDWGAGGYFTLPYDYLADRDLSDDFWTIRAMEIETNQKGGD